MKRFISIAVSVTILLIIYSKIDFQGLINVFKNCDPFLMFISLGMVFPITMFTSWRLQQLMPKGTSLGFLEANRLILGASVLNMVLPSKMGDIAKAYFLRERGHLSGSLSLSLVIFEKTSDMLSLLLWCVFGLVIYSDKNSLFWIMTAAVASGLIFGLLLLGSRKFAQIFFILSQKIAPKKIKQKLQNLQASWEEMHNYFWGDKQQLFKIASTSIFIWFLHLLQIWLFILALRAFTPFWVNLALSPLAILAGLLPLTFAGVGTRDAALIFFYQPYFDAATGAALGLLCTSRYFLPAIIGLPFLGQMMGAMGKISAKK
ncbi:lysylphosphatidylglycerol synthase transmembrane domain-containing protein [Crocosphaera sp. XPORK-15E]|uniref:lysylphosphatidylglycerol synthase transmembrane domain-containing protein n=1 Tax=Crocosphaera sp. XPORK-15E TaxID=3110247 RepID=UPI002B205F4C|nr:lysylphosphatidylglycerol synthase transmembrane domain-containing protein [Crocosphaera sp. XPORK-15E]MEA5533454.1 lysylphosphatidylglycerol synthase transmembrane domain-containing protein [Crocosphaera sp. XPORK-15E]